MKCRIPCSNCFMRIFCKHWLLHVLLNIYWFIWHTVSKALLMTTKQMTYLYYNQNSNTQKEFSSDTCVFPEFRCHTCIKYSMFLLSHVFPVYVWHTEGYNIFVQYVVILWQTPVCKMKLFSIDLGCFNVRNCQKILTEALTEDFATNLSMPSSQYCNCQIVYLSSKFLY